jgi:hypothetical protein
VLFLRVQLHAPATHRGAPRPPPSRLPSAISHHRAWRIGAVVNFPVTALLDGIGCTGAYQQYAKQNAAADFHGKRVPATDVMNFNKATLYRRINHP